MYKLFLVSLVILTTYYLLLTTAYAEGISLGIYPPIFQIDATPPANVQAPLTVENQGDNPISLSIELRPFKSSDAEDGQIKYISQEEANFEDPLIFQKVKILDPTSSLEQAITTLSLSPKQKKDLILRIDLPKGQPAGDYYFSIIFLTAPDQVAESNSSQSVSAIASNVLLSIGPKGKPSGNVLEFSSPILVEKGPIPFTVRVKNTTNHFITPKGEILIKNIFGQTIGKVELAQTNILANNVRSIPSAVNDQKLTQDQIAAYWPEEFVLGIYNAKLTLALSDEGPLFKRDILFFAFPFQTTALILLGLTAIIYFILKVKASLAGV